jgi:hypothetical protein
VAKAKYTGDLLWDVLSLKWPEFHSKHPDIKQGTYKGKRVYWRTKLAEGKITMPEEPKLVKSWEVSAFNRETNEWETTLNHAYYHNQNPEETVDDYFPQVESARITPTKRKRAERLGKLILGYGDGQVDFRIIRDPRTLETEVAPLHNVEMHRIILQLNAHYMPKTTVNGGDVADLAASSSFPKDSDHFDSSMTLALQWIHDFNAQLVADNPNAQYGGDAEHHITGGNHEDRAKRRVLSQLPEFYNFYRPGEDYPAFTFYSMARLQDLGIKYHSGYPNGEYVYGDPEYPQILFKHGKLVGNTAVYKEADRNPTINVVRWHNHGERMIKRTTREGQQLFYLILGSACINNGPVSGYGSSVDDLNQPVKYHNQDHVNSFVMIRDYGKGRFEPVTIDVVDGKAYYDEMEWDGSKPYDWEYRYGYIKENENDGN